MFYQKNKTMKIAKLDQNKLSESIKCRDSPAPTINNQQNRKVQDICDFSIDEFNHLDWGYFKYIKSKNQISKLKELKNEYEKIRDMKVEEERILQQQCSREAESSKEGSDKSQQSLREGQRDKLSKSHWAQYQKRQLESMINNSIGKIEQLLRNEMEYKKRVLDLESEIRVRSSSDKVELKQKIGQSINKGLQIEEQGERTAFLARIKKLEEQKKQKSEDILRLKQQNKKLQDFSFLAKNEMINLKMDVNRAQLEKQTVQKSKDLYIKKLQKSISILEADLSRTKEKLEKQQKSSHKLMQSISKVKQSEDAERSGKKNLEDRLSQLERIAESEKQEKKQFLRQVQSIIAEIQAYKKHNQDLKNQNQSLKKIVKQLQSQQQHSFSRFKPSYQDQEVKKSKITQSEKKQLRQTTQYLQRQLNLAQSKFQQKVVSYQERLEQAESELQKIKKHHCLTLQIQQSKHRAEIQMAKNQLAVILREKNAERIKHQKQREQIHVQQALRQREKQYLVQQYNRNLELKEMEIDKLKNQIEEIRRRMRQEYQQQLFTLVSRLDEVVLSNQKCRMQNSRLVKIELEYQQIRERMIRMIGVTSQIEHLWEIKEQQYSNIKELLNELQD